MAKAISTCVKTFPQTSNRTSRETTMVQRLKEVDVVVIGVGMVGSIVAKELAAAGYKVVGLERGQTRLTVREFQSPAIHDELRFDIRKAMMQDNTREPVTFRNL